MKLKKWRLQKNADLGKYGAIIEEREYNNAPGVFFYYSRILGSHIPLDTNFHKSLNAAKAYIRSELRVKGNIRFKWEDVTDEEE